MSPYTTSSTSLTLSQTATFPDSEAGVPAGFGSLLNRFAPISLAEMANVNLLRRSEVKYLLHERQLYAALANLLPYYRVLAVEGMRLNPYHTLYFDTADFALYRHHHAGGRNRYKVRSRVYVQSSLAFLEVKHKVNGERTIKNRLPTDSLLADLTAEAGDFIAAHAPLGADGLEVKLWNAYWRITLVSRHRPERVTLDVGLRFGWGETAVSLPHVAIVEIKHNGRLPESDFARQMRVMRLRPTGFSKYCVGVALLYPAVKHNRFKPKLRQLAQMTQTMS